MDWIFLILLVPFCTVSASIGKCQRIVCYYTNWAQYRPGRMKFQPEDIDPTLCTHIIYAFATITDNQLHPLEWNDERTNNSNGMFSKFVKLKHYNPKAKMLLSVGGWKMGSLKFSALVKRASYRTHFATTAVRFLRVHNFDGLDLDWEFPASRGSPPEDKSLFTALVQEIRHIFNKYKIGKHTLLLTAAVPGGKSEIDAGYDVPAFVKVFDFINLMSYNFHGNSATHTGHHSPLYSEGKDDQLSMDWAAKYWVSKGCPKDKLVIGLATYGQSYMLTNKTSNGLNASVSTEGKPGVYTKQPGLLSYYEICEMEEDGKVLRISHQGYVPYLVMGDLWVGYDDMNSLRRKVKYVMDNKYGGVMIWTMDLDDFKGVCGYGLNPLMTAIVNSCAGEAKFRAEKEESISSEAWLSSSSVTISIGLSFIIMHQTFTRWM